jgi:hypothetical protein
MGHTFGLPHCKDPLGIMTRGFDHFNRCFTFRDPPSRTGLRGKDFTPEEEARFAPVSASFLRWSRWFQLDKTRYRDDAPPVIAIDEAKGVVEVASDSGVPWVGFWTGPDIVSYRGFADGRPPKNVEVPLDEIADMLGGQPLSRVTAIGANGESSGADVGR